MRATVMRWMIVEQIPSMAFRKADLDGTAHSASSR